MNKSLRSYNVLDLFSGIGGFSLGLERAGMDTVGFCEIEPYCQKVLKKHWPDVPIYNDVRTLPDEYTGPPVDVICGGYPCQPFSVAGKREGAADDRHLWPAMFACIKQFRPRWIIGENVAGHINMGIDQVLSDLEIEAYTTRAFVIPACALDAPHRRDRVWIIAHSNSQSQPNVTINGEKEGIMAKYSSTNTNGKRRCGRNAKRKNAKNVRELYRSAWENQGGMGIWGVEPPVGRVANGIPRRVDRLRALGNAVVPQIPENIGRMIMAAEREWDEQK